MHWYALFVKTGAEDIVRQYLHYHFDKKECYCIIPKRKLKEKTKGQFYEVIKPLFPGYILVNMDINENVYYIIRQIPNVYNILKNPKQYYSEINDEEMEPILKLINENNIIDYSKVFFENSSIYVKSGPLEGYEGLIQKVDKRKGRVKVALEFLGNIKIVELGVEVISKF